MYEIVIKYSERSFIAPKIKKVYSHTLLLSNDSNSNDIMNVNHRGPRGHEASKVRQ